MLLLLGVVIIVLLTYVTFLNFSGVKEYIRWRAMIGKLPKLKGNKFLIGHSHLIFGYSNEEVWKYIREWLTASCPILTFYMGPFLVFVLVVEADEIEAVISSMKNLQKADPYNFLHQWLENGLLTSTGHKWQMRRKILTPAFHFSILREFVETFTREASALVKKIEDKYLDKPVDIAPLMSDFTLLTINETSMGTKLDTSKKEGMTYKNAVYSMANILFERAITPWFHYKFIFDCTSKGRNEKKLVKVMHTFTDKIIENRAKRFEVFESPVGDDDGFNSKKRKYPLLDILLNAKFKEDSIDETGIREEVNTFMFEGHDTTAVSLMYTCMLLACNSEIQEDVYQEIIEVLGTDPAKELSYANLQNMTFMERCIKESLRLYPSVAFIGRKLDSDVSTKCGIVPRGTTCFIQLYDLHRNEKYWTNPHKFDPSRHLPENSRDRHPFAYIPFSAGPRNCIGQRFAMLEMKATICELLRKFIIKPVDTPETIVLTQDLVLRPKNGLKVKFVLRNH